MDSVDISPSSKVFPIYTIQMNNAIGSSANPMVLIVLKCNYYYFTFIIFSLFRIEV